MPVLIPWPRPVLLVGLAVCFVCVVAGCGRKKPAAENGSEAPAAPTAGPIQPPATATLPGPPRPAQPGQSDPHATATDWGDRVAVSGYTIRPPRGYSPWRPPQGSGPPGADLHFWVGERRLDGTAAQIQIFIGTPPPQEPRPRSAGEFLGVMLQGVANRRVPETWNQSAFADEKIGGLTFQKCAWSGRDKQTGVPMHGVMDAAIDGPVFISLSSQDSEPHHATTLPLAERSFWTFRKTGQ